MITPTPRPVLDNLRPRTHFLSERSMLTRIVVGLLAGAFYITMVFLNNGLPFALGLALLSEGRTLEM